MKSLITSVEKYQNELKEIDEELLALPEGRLAKLGKYYYQATKDKRIGITKNPKLIRKLCRKRYLIVRQKQINTVLSHAFNKLADVTPIEIISSFSRTYQELPRSYFFHPSVEPWLAEPHQKNPYPIEDGNYYSKNGVAVRSKSEALIANLLEEYEIPYHYDIRLTLGAKTIYPDFIIKNPFNGKTIIWEHYGALNQLEYEQKMTNKMRLYHAQGYIPFETLIYTFEFDVKTPRRLQDLIERIILHM